MNKLIIDLMKWTN